MSRRRNADEVARLLREADRDLAKGLTISDFCRKWAAPRKLVQPKWESPGRVSPGGTHEKAKERRRGRAITT